MKKRKRTEAETARMNELNKLQQEIIVRQLDKRASVKLLKELQKQLHENQRELETIWSTTE
jgi:hypothetical protein